MKRFLLIVFAFLICCLTTQAQVNNGPVYPNTGSAPSGPAGGDLCSTSTYPNPTVCGVFGSAGPVGPVLNVLNYGASPSLADNATAFTAATTAFNAASQMASNPAISQTAQAQSAAATSLNPSITINVGDSVLVFVVGVPGGRTITVSDSSGTNVYQQLTGVAIHAGGTNIQLFGTPAQGAKTAATSVTLSITGANAALGVLVATASNVGSYRFMNITSNAGSTGASLVDASTQDNNNIFVMGAGWYENGVNTTASTNQGILQQTFGSTTALVGGALVTQVQATPAATTNSVTFNFATNWATVGIELRSRTLARPILYIPPGVYSYSSGLSFTQPGTLMCTPGTATLNYIGSAHAVDMGATQTVNTLNTSPLGEDGCDFTGGAAMTQGINFATYNVLGYVRNSTFKNFGTSTSNMIAGQCSNWDIEVGPQNRFFLTDGNPRTIYQNNIGSCDSNSFTRFHDNLAACWQGDIDITAGCTAAQAGVGVILNGAQQKFYHNNFAFWSPDVRITCSTGVCFGSHVDDNILETSSDTGTSNVIQFGGTQNGMIVAQNAANLHSNTSGFIGPVGGSDVLSGARINFNTLANQPNTTPVVKLNNVANQTGNTSYANVCSTSTTNSTYTQCPSPIHTTGGSISPWINTIEGETIASLTTCAAVGTGASPSVAACGAALAGHFSCATAATGATCTINTTGVTANSTIIVQDSDTTNTGTLLSVTCNTSTTVDPTVRLLASQTAGTGFTINLGTVTTNPACFQYWIIN